MEKYPCQISDEAVAKIKNVPMRTGYEREYDDKVGYWLHEDIEDEGVSNYNDERGKTDELLYNNGNYYNSKELAMNVVKADRLLQKLRQWQALNDGFVNWNGRDNVNKFYISYDYLYKRLTSYATGSARGLFNIYFSSKEKVNEVIEAFKDELLWFFTEYKQRLDEKRGEKS